MQRILIEGGLTLLPGHGLQPVSVQVEDGLISATAGSGRARPGRDLDARGLLVLPGLIDLHGDWFELLVQPRPGVGFPLDLALAQADRQFLLNGVTTAYLAQGCSWEGGIRGVPAAAALVEWLQAHHGRLGCDMRVHLRHEIFHVDAVPIVEQWMAGGGVQLLVLNEHFGDYEARVESPSKLAFWASECGHDTASIILAIRAARARKSEVQPTLVRLCAVARASGVPVGSHDDPDPATRASFSALGANIAEFPLTRATAAAARAAAEPVIFVNVVGLGPFAGILALTLHNTGDLAKLYSEAIENIEKRQLDGIRASAGSPFTTLRLGALPHILPLLTSQALYYFESNTRSATIIGVVGAGGIGLLLTERIRHYRWGEVTFLILIILGAVFVIDTVSQRLRILLIEGRKEPLVA